MKPLLIAIAALGMTATAHAAELPLSGTYGSPAGCFILAAGGMGAVFHDGMRPDGTVIAGIPSGDNAPMIVLTATELVGVEMSCAVDAVDGTAVRFECGDYGPAFSAIVKTDGDRLTYADDEATQPLTRCQ
jgi:hypothetical protein